MADTALQAQIDAASAYEEFYLPALFQEWAPRVVDAGHVQPGHRVLDVACGTGVVAREAASRVGADGAVVGLDRNPGMLAVAKRMAPQVQWIEGSAEELPFPDNSFDAVVSQFGLMFFTDRRQALQEMQRVLVPGGRLAVAVWDSLENTPGYAAAVALLDRVAGQAAAEALSAPYVLGDQQELAQLFTTAEVAGVTVTTLTGSARFPSPRSMIETDLRGWLPVMGVILTEDQIGSVLAEADGTMSAYIAAEGRVEFDAPAHIVTWMKP